MTIMHRVMFIVTAKLIFVGIWLTGWSDVPWSLFITPVLITLFAITGVCPSTIFSRYKTAKNE